MKRLVALVMAMMLLPGLAFAQPSDTHVIGDGHIDMGPRFADGRWTVQIRDDTVNPAVWRDLSTVVLQVVDAANTRIPDDPAYAFLGPVGGPVWLLPQVQRPGVLWPGWNTQDPEVVSRVGREVTWRLRGVRGPGAFVLFLSGNFGAPQVIFDSSKPYPQETGIETNTHVHGNWAFSAPGTYLLDIEMTGAAKTGETLTDRQTLRVHIGNDKPVLRPPPPPSPVSAATTEPAPPASVPWVWVAGGAALIVLGGIVFLVRRRSA